MSAANFDCGLLLESKIKMDEIWADAQASQEYVAEVDALQYLWENQTHKTFTELQDPSKDRSIKINWLSDCATGEVEDCGDECDIDGNEIGDSCRDYELDICKEIGLKVAHKKYRTSIWSKEEVLARARLSKMKQMDEYIVSTIISLLDTFTGTNQDTQYGMLNGDTYIPATDWNASLMAYFQKVIILNRMRDAFMLSGNNLFQTIWNAEMNASNANGAGDAARFRSMKKYFDLFNIDGTLGAQKTFLLRPGSYAFVNKAYYDPTPTQHIGPDARMLYSVQSKNLPFISYDVIAHTICTGNEYYDVEKIMFKGGFFQNPIHCGGEMTGSLSFRCGSL